MDEDDFACRDFAEAEANVDEPLVDDELHDFGLVREGVQEAGRRGVPSPASRAP